MRDAPCGLFVGLSTLDIIHRVTDLPGRNAKTTALRQEVCGGGPALNAAVLFATLGGRATLLTRLGRSGVARLIRDDLESHGVTVADRADDSYTPAVSTIAVHDATGDRQIVSTDARGGGEGGAATDGAARLADYLQDSGGVDLVHCDGHHRDLTLEAARWANQADVPCVVDAGRWKPVMGELVPLATDVVCSADFVVPGRGQALLPWLLSNGVQVAAITNGAGPVHWATASAHGSVEPPRTTAVDTTGAGDFFHGAYSYARVIRDGEGRALTPPVCLQFASTVAALKCAQPGTRSWLDTLAGISPLDGHDGEDR